MSNSLTLYDELGFIEWVPQTQQIVTFLLCMKHKDLPRDVTRYIASFIYDKQLLYENMRDYLVDGPEYLLGHRSCGIITDIVRTLDKSNNVAALNPNPLFGDGPALILTLLLLALTKRSLRVGIACRDIHDNMDLIMIFLRSRHGVTVSNDYHEHVVMYCNSLELEITIASNHHRFHELWDCDLVLVQDADLMEYSNTLHLISDRLEYPHRRTVITYNGDRNTPVVNLLNLKDPDNQPYFNIIDLT